MAALIERRRTGLGQHIDLAQGEALLCLDAEAVLEYTMNERTVGFMGNRSRSFAPHGIYPCSGDDQWIAISVETDDQFRALLKVLGINLEADYRKFKCPFKRLREADSLDKQLGQETQRFDRWVLTNELQMQGVPAYPVLNARGQLDDPHLQFRRACGITSPENVRIEETTFTSPWKLSRTPVTFHRPTVSIGEDNEVVLEHLLGRSASEIARLNKVGVLR
jgi:benzylsuccinate CoA-transferase BbsF subunit